MPLTCNEGTVSNGPQHFPEGGSVFHVVVSNGIGVVAGEQFCPGGVTLGGVVELGETQPALGQPVEVGSLDFPAIAADVGISHVIDHDQDNVWTRSVRLGPAEGGFTEKADQKKGMMEHFHESLLHACLELRV